MSEEAGASVTSQQERDDTFRGPWMSLIKNLFTERWAAQGGGRRSEDQDVAVARRLARVSGARGGSSSHGRGHPWWALVASATARHSPAGTEPGKNDP